MTPITVTNVDWTIIDSVKSALTDALIEELKVFEAVTVTTSERQARQGQYIEHPAAIVRYLTTREHVSPEGVVGCVLSLELMLATRVESPAGDESTRLEEILRLVNAAKNAIEAERPSDAVDWADGEFFAPAVAFGRPEIDTAERQPWAVAKLPVDFTYVLESSQDH